MAPPLHKGGSDFAIFADIRFTASKEGNSVRKMRKRFQTMVMIAGILGAGAHGLAADEAADVSRGGERQLTGSLGLTFNSKYIWRGQNLIGGPVVQPEGSLSYQGFSGIVWANYDVDEGSEWTELDCTLDYSTSLGCVSPDLNALSVSAGYTYYTFPNLDEGDESHEVYLAAELDVLLSPSLATYYDFDEGDGVYYEFGLEHAFSLGKPTLTLGGSVGYNDGQWGYESSFSAGILSAGLEVPLTPSFSWTVSAAASLALDNQYDDEFFAGTGIAWSF
jgi:hypothetical protein